MNYNDLTASVTKGAYQGVISIPSEFTYKEQKEFETIEDTISSLEEELAEVEKKISAGGSDYMKLMELEKKRTELSEQLEERMERWAELTELWERIEAEKKQR